MEYLNKATLIGLAENQPELKTFDNGSTLAQFTLAIPVTYNEKQWKEYHRIVVWGEKANKVYEKVKEGSLVCCEGRIKHRSYEDKEGNKKKLTEISCFDVLLLSAEDTPEKGNTNSEPVKNSFDTSEPPTAVFETDPNSNDLPF